jgi:hypothetical protein
MYHSYAIEYVGDAIDFNGNPAYEYKVVLGSNSVPPEVELYLEDLIEAGLE